MREWLLRADQSIRANRLLTRAAQGGGGRIRVRGDCSFAVIRGVPGCNSSGSVFPVVGGCEFVEGRNSASRLSCFSKRYPRGVRGLGWNQPLGTAGFLARPEIKSRLELRGKPEIYSEGSVKTVEIPPFLSGQIKEGKAVLVLGAGASLEALTASGGRPPSTIQLRDQLSLKFLGGKLKDRPLSQVAEYAISESSLSSVQEFIREVFEPFQPTPAHCMLPTFRWRGLATTNFDRLIEKAYATAADPAPRLVTFIENGDRVEETARDRHSLMLLKLHGCITKTGNPSCPLILTTDQYIDHRDGRSRLFDRLTEWGYEHPIVFIGHSLQDPDLRMILKALATSGLPRSRYFAVIPDADDIEKRAFELQRISVLCGTFDQFMRQLDADIPSPLRSVVVASTEHQLLIAHQFRKQDTILSASCVQFLQSDVDYVKGITAVSTVSPSDFYRGFNPGFSAIEQELDVRRQLGDTILSDIFLVEEAQHRSRLELILVKAHAGAGKSVLLQRLAWDAAHDYGCLCLFLRTIGIINTSALQELIQACDQRIYLFVDDAADRVRELEALATHIGSLGKFLTVILAERINEWNVLCQSLSKTLTEEYELRYLSEPEIDKLLALLNHHRSLGKLESKSPADQKTAFKEIAGRQLLVALHETTLGERFEKIIQDEFDNIQPFSSQADIPDHMCSQSTERSRSCRHNLTRSRGPVRGL